MMRIPYETMVSEFERVLKKKGFKEDGPGQRQLFLPRTAWPACTPMD